MKIRPVVRRFHLHPLVPGTAVLDPVQSRHAARVLRLRPGDAVELFDGLGLEGRGVIASASARAVTIRVEQVGREPEAAGLTVASAVPKGRRADFMIEKLSELNVAAFRPVRWARGVRVPSASALARFGRIAVESAKQCGRSRVMRILEPAAPEELRGRLVVADPEASERLAPGAGDVVVIGPEGGLTPEERRRLAGAAFARLAPTVLRVETAAVAAAAILAC